MNFPRELKQLAIAYGIQLEYEDNDGVKRRATPEGARAILRALGIDVTTDRQIKNALEQRNQQAKEQLIDPVLVAWQGRKLEIEPRARASERVFFELYLENGDHLEGEIGRTKLPQLPLGYHELAVETADRRSHALLIAAPARAHAPARSERAWGTFLPLYALRSPNNHGIGDFQSLGELMRWTSESGGGYVGTLPLLASYLDEPFEPSPYSPVSRLFWNELYLDLNHALSLFPCAAAHAIAAAPGYAQAVEALNQASLIDYRAVARCKRRILEPLSRCFFESGHAHDPRFVRFLELYPRVQDYARFRAATERMRVVWQQWPQRMRDGELAVTDFDVDDADYHVFVQYLCHLQLERLAATPGARLYLDLPIGVNGDGYDVWRERDLFARGASAGAPPDAFFTHGQNWGFPPLNPLTLRDDGYAYLRDTIRTHLNYAGALRLDHVMALHRLYWVPDGGSAQDGVYVRYAADELYALLCLESARHEALIIGEDLGTVPPEVRVSMKRHHVLRMYVVQFEATTERRDPLPRVPAEAVVSLNTHDMPPFEAYRQALDADLRAELGLISTQQVEEARATRAGLIQRMLQQMQRAGFLHDPATPEELRDALLDYLSASESQLLLVNLEDLWAERLPQNVPGTASERPNWRRVAQHSLEHIISSPEINAALKRLDGIRRED